MTMASRIVVLRDGRIEQVGSPIEIYRNPVNLFVAGFIGSPRMNFITGGPAAEHGADTIGIRPEHLTLSAQTGLWPGRVGVVEHLGSDTFVHVTTEAAGTLTVRAVGELEIRHGDTVFVTPNPDRIHRFDKQGQILSRPV